MSRDCPDTRGDARQFRNPLNNVGWLRARFAEVSVIDNEDGKRRAREPGRRSVA